MLKNNPNKFIERVSKRNYWDLKGNTPMHFDAIIGNPPYQISAGASGGKDNPIYHCFMDAAFSLASRVTLITPGRFLFDAGQTPKTWNRKILADPHLKVITYWQKSNDVFPNVDIKGGVAVTYRDESENFGAIGIFSFFPELNSILEKVQSFYKGSITKISSTFPCLMFDSIVSSQGIFRFSTKFMVDNPKIAAKLTSKGTGTKIISKEFETLPQIFLEKRSRIYEYIELIGRVNSERVSRFIRRDWLENSEYLNCYKVFVPEANGTGTLGEILSTPIIGMPMTGSTDTFISIGRFSSSSEAENCMKYIKTKFARAMLGVLKATQHNTKETWRNVPLQDFTDKSDIDWNRPVPEIDAQLYKKYGLTQEETAFIESMIRPMDARSNIFYNDSKFCKATMEIRDGKYVILPGSEGRLELTPTGKDFPSIISRRQQCAADGTTKEEDGTLLFLKEYFADSPSEAAKLLAGSNVSGNVFWKDANGVPLKEKVKKNNDKQ